MPPVPQQSRFDLAAVIAEAARRSPAFARIHGSLMTPADEKDRWKFVMGEAGKSSFTNPEMRTTFIDPSLSPDKALVHVMYEAANAFFAADLEKIGANLRAGKYRTPQAYADAMLKEETGTVVTACLETLEAQITYLPEVQKIVLKHVTKDASGQLHWKSDGSRRASEEAFPVVLATVTATDDETGQSGPARQIYGLKWQRWFDRFHSPSVPAGPIKPYVPFDDSFKGPAGWLKRLVRRSPPDPASQALRSAQAADSALWRANEHTRTANEAFQRHLQSVSWHNDQAQETLQRSMDGMRQLELLRAQQPHHQEVTGLLQQNNDFLRQAREAATRWDSLHTTASQLGEQMAAAQRTTQFAAQQNLSQQTRQADPHWYSNVAPADLNDLNRRFPMGTT
jgi:hypothetical protein